MPPNFQQSIQNLSRYLSGLDLGSLSQENISALFKSLSGLSSSLGSFNPTQPQPTQLISPQGGVPSQGFGMTAEGLPEPTAPQVQLQFQEGLGVSVQQAQQDFIATAERQRDEAIKRQEAINAQLMEILSESDPRKRETFAQEEKIIRDQLKAAETAASTLEEDFKTRRRIVSEMEQLLTEGNALIKQQIEKPASLRFIQKSASRTMSDVQARAGVLSAVIAGVDGNINMAHSIIGNATNAVRAQWNDVVNYNNAVLNLTNQGLLAIEAEHKKFAEIELGLAESNLARLQETEDYIKGLMTDPKTAQFIADAGISLNDSIEEINTKMAEQTKKQEIVQFQNEMTAEGYEFTPVEVEGAVSFEVGGKKLWFKPPVDDKLLSVAEAKSLGVPFGTTRSQAAAMGIIPGSGTGTTKFTLSTTQKNNLITKGFSGADVDKMQESVNLYGPEATLSAMKGDFSEEQITAFAEEINAFDALNKIESGIKTPSQIITSIVDTANDDQIKKLKKVADNAGVSSFWTGKKADIKRLLETPEMIAVIENAIAQGLSMDEIINIITG